MIISDEMVKEATKLERYLVRQGRQELVNELRMLNPDELKQRILKQALHREETLDAKANDQALRNAKHEVKDLQAPYSDSLRMNAKIARFINLLLKEKE